MSRWYNLDELNRQVVFTFDYSEKELVKEFKKTSMNARFNPTLKQWIIPVNDWTRPKLVPFIKEHKFKPCKEKAKEYEKFDYSTPQLKEYREDLELLDLTYIPRDYQIESLDYGLDKGSFINGDDCGLGKTFEAILYAEYTDSFPCLVITPASVKYNWQEKWLEIVGPHRVVSVIESAPTKKNPNNWDADVVIINYDIIAKKQGTGATVKFDELLLKPWKMKVFDEAHFLKEPSSQRSKAASKIVKKNKVPVQLLTGTATMSRPAELWNLLVLIGKEKEIAKDKREYDEKYCNGHQTNFGWETSGATYVLELNHKLRQTCYLRREKSEVLKDLPEVIKSVLHVPITNKKEIDKANENIIEFIRETKGEEAAESAMNAEALVALGLLRQLSIQGKLAAIEQYLRDWKVGGQKLVVFGLHKEPLEYLAEKFKSKLLIGGITAIKKQAIIKEWMANDSPFLFANISSAGTGVDGLQEVCSNMLCIELPWRPSDLEQMIARLDRSGQKFSTSVVFALSKDTIDQQMWEMLEEKEIATSAVNQGIDILKEETGMKVVMKKLLKQIKSEKQNH